MNNQILTGKARLLPSASEMVLDPGPRGTVNVDMSRAVASPELDARGFVAADLGAARIGESVQEAGGFLGKLALAQMSAVNLRHEAEADNAMSAAEASMKEALAREPDETKWGAIATKHIGDTRGALMKMPLSSAAKEAVEMKAERWAIHLDGATKVASAQESIRRAGGIVQDKLAYSEESQDALTFEHTLKGAVSQGYMSEEAAATRRLGFTRTGERKAKEAEAAAYDAAQNAAIGAADAGGEAVALKALKQGAFGKLDASGEERLRNAIQQVGRDRAAASMDGISTGILSGDINSPAKIDALDDPHLTPVLRQKAKDWLMTRDAQAEAMDRETNGVRNAVEMRQKVRDYSAKDDPDRTKYFQLVKDIGTRVEQSSAGEITGELYKKYGSAAPKGTVRPEIQQNVSKSLDITFDAMTGAMPWRSKVPVLDSAGKPATDLDGNPKTTTVEDPAMRQQALDAQTVIESKMADWFRDNPDKVNDLGAVQKQLQAVLPEGTRAAALLGIQKQKQMINPEPPNLGAQGATGPAGPSAPLDESLIDTVKDMETFIPEAYGDYKQTSVGYGTRAKSEGEVLTKEEADSRLREELGMHANRIDSAAQRAGVELSANQRNALISFDFNTGRGGHLLETSGGDMAEVKRRLLLYTKAGGEELKGLVKRRAREAALFDKK